MRKRIYLLVAISSAITIVYLSSLLKNKEKAASGQQQETQSHAPAEPQPVQPHASQPTVLPNQSEESAPSSKSKHQATKLKPGDVVLFEPNSLPSPFHGFVGVKTEARWNRVMKLVDANDMEGVYKECDNSTCFFIRAQTKLKVIDPEAVLIEKDDYLAEVRVLSGASIRESALVPASMLGRGPQPPKDLANIDTIPDAERKEMFSGFITCCNESLAEAASSLSTLGDSGVRLALRTKRFEFEVDAAKIHQKKYGRFMAKSPRKGSEFEAVVWHGLIQGWPYLLKDY